ncbi:helical backbone metal receptor [Chitinimonas sp. BJYL2]|uniref:helical backbone metal receptor n=1 Tax=Chitinimonas sp. BJYL2 TaxID=2976696 RepID=UPI0022B4D6E6|nr:helical backbone metal receptor [Chitinimonas sp. BJYL2]
MSGLRSTLWMLMAAPVLASVSVRDDSGSTVELSQPARRIVSLSPHATELLYAMGAGALLVGRDGASDYPGAARALPVVGVYGAFNAEAIIALKPDLVIAWEGPRAGTALDTLKRLGIPIFASQPATVRDIPAAMRAFGVLTGRDGATPARRFEQEWRAIEARYARGPILTVVPQVGDEPAMTVNGRQFVSAVFAACGTRNPFADEVAAVPLLSAEALLAARPQAIVALAEPVMAAQWLKRWQPLPLKAALLDASPDTLGRPGPRVLAAASTLCARLDKLRKASQRKID